MFLVWLTLVVTLYFLGKLLPWSFLLELQNGTCGLRQKVPFIQQLRVFKYQKIFSFVTLLKAKKHGKIFVAKIEDKHAAHENYALRILKFIRKWFFYEKKVCRRISWTILLMRDICWQSIILLKVFDTGNYQRRVHKAPREFQWIFTNNFARLSQFGLGIKQ